VPEVTEVGRRTGRAELDEHAEGVHSSEIEVDLKASERGREAIIADIRQRLSGCQRWSVWDSRFRTASTICFPVCGRRSR
jgi:Cu/Ag efflux pump CusA